MGKPLDPAIKAILEKYKIDAKQALWDCHGTWVMYHRYLERVAVEAGISFDAPQILEANGAAKSVALCVTGRVNGSKTEWSVGEAAPGNNKNAYPYAMAEKRGKDRVILKLIGLHGLVYSEDEMQGASAPEQSSLARFLEETKKKIAGFKDPAMLAEWWNSDDEKQARRDFALDPSDVNTLKEAVMDRIDKLKQGKAA